MVKLNLALAALRVKSRFQARARNRERERERERERDRSDVTKAKEKIWVSKEARVVGARRVRRSKVEGKRHQALIHPSLPNACMTQ